MHKYACNNCNCKYLLLLYKYACNNCNCKYLLLLHKSACNNCNFTVTLLVIAQVHVNLDRPEVEGELVRKITTLTEQELDELNSQLETMGLKVVHVQLVSSILIWILCSTEDLFLELNRLVSNGRLRVVLATLFNSLKVITDDDLRVKDLKIEGQFTLSGS